LAKAIEYDEASEQCDKAITNDIPKTNNYVLDDCSLVQRVPWTKSNTYGAIADSYVDFTVENHDTLMCTKKYYPQKTTLMIGVSKDTIHWSVSSQIQCSVGKG